MGGVSSELPKSLVAINVNDIKKPQTFFFVRSVHFIAYKIINTPISFHWLHKH